MCLGIFSSLGFYIDFIYIVHLAFISNITSTASNKQYCFHSLKFIMSRNKSFTLFKDLKPRLTKWRVQVKVIRSWKQTPPYADESLEMVLVDETVSFTYTSASNLSYTLSFLPIFLCLQGNKIHASCERSQMFRTQRNLKLGEWGVIEKFKVSGVGKGKYRPTSNQYKITITNETVFSGSDHQDDNIFLSLADYNKISNGSQDVNILIGIYIILFFYIIDTCS